VYKPTHILAFHAKSACRCSAKTGNACAFVLTRVEFIVVKELGSVLCRNQ